MSNLTGPSGTSSSGGTPISPSNGTLTNRSSTIAVAATAQQLAAVNASRKYLLIENLDGANSLWVNFTTTAVQSQPSIELKPGATLVMESSYVTTELISVIGPNAGQAFCAKEG